MKVCKACQLEKPLTEFYAMEGQADGYRSQCRSCYAERCRRYRENNRERRRAWQRAYDASPRARLRRKHRDCGVAS